VLALLLAAAPLCAQAAPDLRALEERIGRLEGELSAYKNSFAELDRLFLQLAALHRDLSEAANELLAAGREAADAGRAVEARIDAAVSESRAMIDYLKTRVTERPTLLVEGDLGWRALAGAAAGVSLVWEPLPWLGLRAGAELEYSDGLAVRFPLLLTLRFRLD
jgi:hypothetical protein